MTAPPKKGTTDQPSELLAKVDIDAILESRHWDPFAVLGLHAAGDGFIARCFLPGAAEVTAETLSGKEIGVLKRIDPAGIFAGDVAVKKLQPIRYRARNDGECEREPESVRVPRPDLAATAAGARSAEPNGDIALRSHRQAAGLARDRQLVAIPIGGDRQVEHQRIDARRRIATDL